MSISRKLKTAMLAAIVCVVGSEAANEIGGTSSFSLVSAPAEARVGRPLPGQRGGVARRTTRRCAAGVYNC